MIGNIDPAMDYARRNDEHVADLQLDFARANAEAEITPMIGTGLPREGSAGRSMASLKRSPVAKRRATGATRSS